MRRCLVVDDSAIIRKVARLVLERVRFGVEEAEGVSDALESCRKQLPDVILLDWHLPGLPASDFLAGLRDLLTDRKPHIIYCTTDNDPADITKALHAGCDDVLIKPFTRADLEAKLAVVPLGV